MNRLFRRSLSNWFGVSLALHASLVLMVWQVEIAPTPRSRPAPSRVRISLVAPPTNTPHVASAPPATNSTPVPAKVVPSKPKRRPKPKPKPEKAIDSILEEPRVPEEAVEPATLESDRVAAADFAAGAAPEAVGLTTESAVSDSIDPVPDYVALVRSRIESKKRYPAMARRRLEEGLVLAHLSIGSDGNLDSVEVSAGGPMLLRRATRNAVEQAAPFPVPPRGSIRIDVPIRWRFDR